MSPELHTTYQLTVETLSPLHIASGKGDLLLDYDFILEGNRALVIELDRLLGEIDEERLRAAAADPRLSRLLAPGEAERYKAYELEIAAGRPQQIREHMKDAFRRFYIPGSSIKGALRTALAWAAYQGPLRLGGVGKRNDPRKADDLVEHQLFDYDLRETHRDLFRALRLTDAYPQSDVIPGALPVVVFSLRGQPPSLQPRGNPTFVEVVPKGTILEATLTLDEYALRPEHRERGMAHFRRRHLLDRLVEHCRAFSAELVRQELEFCSRYGSRKLQGFYQALAERQASLSSGEFLLAIAWGAGWRAKTIGTKLKPGEVGKVAQTYGLERWQRRPLFPGVFPKTRRLVGERQAEEPLGWVRMRLRSPGGR